MCLAFWVASPLAALGLLARARVLEEERAEGIIRREKLPSTVVPRAERLRASGSRWSRSAARFLVCLQ